MGDKYNVQDLYKFFNKSKTLYKDYYRIYENNLRKFFLKANIEYKTFYRLKKELDKYLSTDFNFLELINPDENKLSDLIVLLLDKDGVHGQGSVFFDLFIRSINENFDKNINFQNYKLYREKSTHQKKRIDIFIELEDYIIAIENKPWAIEQQNQIENYIKYLENQRKDFLLIYLHGFGEKTYTLSEEDKERYKNHFIETSYIDFLIPWLKNCYRECESQKVRFFLQDFIKWIENNFYNIQEEA